MDVLQILVGSIIQMVEIIHDYLQLTFTDGTILNIYNKYQYDGESVLTFEGKKLISAIETDIKIILDIEDGGKIEVGLLDEDYNGPEAMELIRKDEPPVVW